METDFDLDAASPREIWDAARGCLRALAPETLGAAQPEDSMLAAPSIMLHWFLATQERKADAHELAMASATVVLDEIHAALRGLDALADRSGNGRSIVERRAASLAFWGDVFERRTLNKGTVSAQFIS